MEASPLPRLWKTAWMLAYIRGMDFRYDDLSPCSWTTKYGRSCSGTYSVLYYSTKILEINLTYLLKKYSGSCSGILDFVFQRCRMPNKCLSRCQHLFRYLFIVPKFGECISDLYKRIRCRPLTWKAQEGSINYRTFHVIISLNIYKFYKEKWRINILKFKTLLGTIPIDIPRKCKYHISLLLTVSV